MSVRDTDGSRRLRLFDSLFSSNLSLSAGVEIAKNVILGGVKSFTCHDSQTCSLADLSSQFFIADADVAQGRNRAQVSAPLLAELNPNVAVDWIGGNLELNMAAMDACSLVILADAPLALQLKVNAYCRSRGIKFISGSVFGVFSWSFCDFGPTHEVHDRDGETVVEIKIVSVDPHSKGQLVKTLEGEAHELQEGDFVSFDGDNNVLGRVEEVVKSDQFVVSSTDATGKHYFLKQKQVEVIAHISLEESMKRPAIVGSDFCKSLTAGSVFLGLWAVEEFRASAGGEKLPQAWNGVDAAACLNLAKKRLPFSIEDSLFGALTVGEEELDETLVKSIAHVAQGTLQPLCAFLGGSLAQEAMKAVSGKFLPQTQWAVFDAREVLASRAPSFDPTAFALTNTRLDGLRICVGDSVVRSLAKTNLFMIGVGAIGCELLKNFAMLGVATEDDASIQVTDPDHIEKSNLNRQFLFRPTDIQQPKATTAVRAVKRMNGAVHVVATLDKVGPDSEEKFSDAFFNKIDIVVNALDNVQARQYVDGRCVALQKPLLESGTLGTKAHVQVIIPFETVSYTDNRDPPSKDIPFCTLKSFPNKIEHTLEWSKDLAFDKQFSVKPAELNKILQECDTLVETLLNHAQGPTFSKTVKRATRMLRQKPATFADCVAVARAKFEHYFANGAKQLLHLFPPSHTVKDGDKDVLFWTPPKVAPTPLIFDATNPLHLDFIVAFANLHAHMWGLPAERDAAKVAEIAAKVKVPDFVPRDGKVVETDPTKKQGEVAAPAPDAAPADEGVAAQEFEKLVRALAEELPRGRGVTLMVEDFEKDDDTNFHIDFVTACGNLRACNYQIKPVDRLEAKRIAGRIIPAIATTTSVASAHVALELIKLVGHATLDEHRNLNTNLALPFYLFSEPDAAIKQHIADTTYTKWDSWDVKLGLDVTVGDVIGYFKKEYELSVQSIVAGAALVYHEDFAADTDDLMRDVLDDIPSGAKFVSLTVMFHDGTEGGVASGPVVRFFLKAALKKRRKEKQNK